MKEIYDRMRRRRDILCASTFSVAEILTGPIKRGTAEEAANAFFWARRPLSCLPSIAKLQGTTQEFGRRNAFPQRMRYTWLARRIPVSTCS
jgi:hypothetical protein